MANHKESFRAAKFLVLMVLAGLCGPLTRAQGHYPEPPIPQNAARQVSPHVWVIMAFPNIAIVAGSRATLVVDTGLGAHNGSIVAEEAKKIGKDSRLYLTTTHFHPEHAGGDQGFPADTILIRNSAQQKELEEIGQEWFERFRGMSQFHPFLEEGHKFRLPDVVFDRDATVDLGGVTARLFWLGAAHTNGDEMIWVPEDGTLIPGDVVQNKLAPHLAGTESSAKAWIAMLDQLSALKPRYIVPDHGDLGDGSLIASLRAFLVDVETRALDLKRRGVSADAAAKMISTDMKRKYSDWQNMDYVSDTVKQIYAKD